MKQLAAVVQMTSGADVGRNLARAGELIAQAADRGAALAVLPENFALFGETERDKLVAAERLPTGEGGGAAGDGPIISTMRELAQRHHIALVLGGMPEQPAADGAAPSQRVHNSCVYLDPSGEIRAVYRKLHLFDVQIPDGASYRESATVAPGSEPVVVQSVLGPLGLSVCYDLRFPELYRALVGRGARLLAVPAAFTLHTGRDHWQLLLQARAVENLCYVLAAAQYGRHNAKRVTYGHSLIVDPWGQILAQVGDHEGVAIAELDFDYQDRLRRELPALDHRRL